MDGGTVAAVRITLQLTRSAARSLRGLDAPSDASRALAARAQGLGLTLRPQHARANDGPLANFFVAELRDAQRADAALEAFRGDPSVDGAWIAPEDELP